MPTSSNAIVYLEAGQTPVDYELMTDSGDHKTFNNGEDVWSGKSGAAPVVRPDGIATGRNLGVPAASLTNDLVDVAAHTGYVAGALVTVSASTDESITRPVGNFARINSVTINAAGAVVVIAGTEAADQVFLETRGTAGGAPYIPVGSYEAFQVRLKTSAAAPIAATEIFQVPGTHAEYSATPSYGVNTLGAGISADSAAETNAFVKFIDALPLTHTAGVAKGVALSYSIPTFGEVSKAFDFVPVDKTYTQNSTPVYRETVGSESSALSAGSFSMYPADGITDQIVVDKGEKLTTKFFQDKDRTPFILTQGTVGIVRSFGADTQAQVDVTLTSDKASAEFAS